MRSAALIAISLALCASALTCSYSPDPASGTLGCALPSRTCPQGYYCATDTKCWKMGEAPGGNDGGADAGNPRTKFIGHWVFDSTGKVEQTCTSGASMTTPLAGDYVDVTAGTASDLVGTYYCAWRLNLAAGDVTKASIVAGQSCQTTDTTGTMTITMHGDAFDFTTADGVSATMASSFTGQYPTATLSCTFKVTGKLTRM